MLLIKLGDLGEYEPADSHRLVELNALAPGSEKFMSLLDAKAEREEWQSCRFTVVDEFSRWK